MARPQDLKKRIKKLIEIAERQGWTVTLTGSNHWKFTNPRGQCCFTPLTPGSYRGVKNTGSQLRRLGLILDKI